MSRNQFTQPYLFLFVIVLLLSLSVLSAPAMAADTDGDGIEDTVEQISGTDYQSSDTDFDGIPDGVEDLNKNGILNAGETNPRDADTDDDGLSDGAEDANHNGIVDTGETNPRLQDSDNDGLNDGLEKGKTASVAGGVSSPGGIPYVGTAPGWTPDADSTTTTDPLDNDTDGDGWLDGNEDANHNGRVDAGETNPNVSDDADHDGYYVMSSGGDDCDDADDSIHPGAVEIWYDGIDQDCDGWNDFDMDQDGYVSADYPGQSGGTSPGEGDCDDMDATVYPGAPELCDGLDNNCDDILPDSETDDDGDGFVEGVIDAGGWDGDSSVIGGEDCDDTDAAIYPGAVEIPNDGIDQDCDGFDETGCYYTLAGDWTGDCRVDLADLAILAANWLVDCNLTPSDPACVPIP